ncbi:MAG TPA: MFS transporter [Candidatus Limnocylindrales bacterium]|nr:MFS transporter [Candidatus Limnocylindrales bacterium]
MTDDAPGPTTNPAPKRAGRREWLGLAVLTIACLIYVMDLTVLHLAVPAISRDLRPSSVELLWIIDIYGFMVAGFLITMGTLGDRIGRRKVLLAGAAAFGGASILAAFSPTAELLILSRALLGIAGATIAPSTLSLIFAMFEDPKQRSTAVGVWVSAFSAGGVVGPILGGILLDQFWWGSVFLLAVPFMAALLVLGPRLLPEYRDPSAGRLDLVSVILSLVAILGLIFGLKQVAQDGVGALSIGAIALALVVGGLWVRRQLRSDDPMFDLGLFRIPRFTTSLVINFLAIFLAIGYFLFVAQYMQLVLGLSPLEAGLWSLPEAVGFLLGPNLAPRIVRHIRPAYLMAGGFALAAVGLGILGTITPATQNGLALVVIGSAIIALGLGPVFGLTTELIVGSAPAERAGAATGMSETGSEVGGALGLSILGLIGLAIYRARVVDSLPAGVPAEAVAAARDTLGAAVEVAAALPGAAGEALLRAAQGAFVEGMQVAALISVVVSIVVAVIALVGLRHVPPTKVEPLGVEQRGEEQLAGSAPLGTSVAGASLAPSPAARESGA